MNAYEALLDEACDIGLIVKEKPLQYNNGRIKGNRIAIRQDINTTTEKACVLAEELGHHHTSVPRIITPDAGAPPSIVMLIARSIILSSRLIHE